MEEDPLCFTCQQLACSMEPQHCYRGFKSSFLDVYLGCVDSWTDHILLMPKTFTSCSSISARRYQQWQLSCHDWSSHWGTSTTGLKETKNLSTSPSALQVAAIVLPTISAMSSLRPINFLANQCTKFKPQLPTYQQGVLGQKSILSWEGNWQADNPTATVYFKQCSSKLVLEQQTVWNSVCCKARKGCGRGRANSR